MWVPVPDTETRARPQNHMARKRTESTWRANAPSETERHGAQAHRSTWRASAPPPLSKHTGPRMAHSAMAGSHRHRHPTPQIGLNQSLTEHSYVHQTYKTIVHIVVAVVAVVVVAICYCLLLLLLLLPV